MMRVALALVLSLGLGCATTPPPKAAEPPQAAADPAAPAASDFDDGEPVIAAEEDLDSYTTEEETRTYRLGFWVIDLAALDVAPGRKTFRFVDFRIFSLLKAGSGDDYSEFSFVKAPHLFTLLGFEREGEKSYSGVIDLEAIALALVRQKTESPNEYDTHFMRVPIISSMYEKRVDGTSEKTRYLYLFRDEREREMQYGYEATDDY